MASRDLNLENKLESCALVGWHGRLAREDRVAWASRPWSMARIDLCIRNHERDARVTRSGNRSFQNVSMRGLGLVLFSLICISAFAAPNATEMLALSDRVLVDTSAHDFLEKLCDDHGGRLTGTPNARAATEQIASELRALGFAPRVDEYSIPGWFRSVEDSVEMLAPVSRKLRVAALSYTQPHKRFEARVVALGRGTEKEFATLVDPAGQIGLVDTGAEPTAEIVRRAIEHRLRGILLTDRVAGGQLLARTGSYEGKPLPLPVYSVTQEEGLWMKRLLARDVTVRVAMQTKSHSLSVTAANIIVRIPGELPETVVVGAHVDSWDLGQGAIDNGLGVAQLYAIAKNLRGMKLRRSVEFVWFDGEEIGMWGSRRYVTTSRSAPIVAMINLDMAGVPTTVNSLGDEAGFPVIKAWNEALTKAGRGLAEGAHNVNWLGSDHTPFLLAGVHAFTIGGQIPAESVRYYHDFADTIDKVSPALISESSAKIAALVYWLAQDDTLTTVRRPIAETRALFDKFDGDSRGESLRVMMAEILPPENTSEKTK